MQKRFGRIGVFLGGTSKERAISLKSGNAVYQALKNSGQQVVLLDPANGFKSELKKKPIDVAFLALHGIGGEDGQIQSILDHFNIPYTGSGPKASKFAFNKEKAKHLLVTKNIPTPEYDILTKRNVRRIVQKWRTPYVVKPIKEGSSIGIFFVETKKNVEERLKKALQKYDRLLIERKIEGREFTVGILGKKALPVIELRPKRKFYDFKAKYTKGLTDYLIPAPISPSLAGKIQKIALQAHCALHLTSMSRVDFMLDQDQRPYVLELNSIPGFTETSLLPKAAKQAGLDFEHLCLYLLEQALNNKDKV